LDTIHLQQRTNHWISITEQEQLKIASQSVLHAARACVIFQTTHQSNKHVCSRDGER